MNAFGLILKSLFVALLAALGGALIVIAIAYNTPTSGVFGVLLVTSSAYASAMFITFGGEHVRFKKTVE